VAHTNNLSFILSNNEWSQVSKYPDTIFCMKSSHFWYPRYRSEQLSSLTKRQSEREHSP
jgi:hypothetical protein